MNDESVWLAALREAGIPIPAEASDLRFVELAPGRTLAGLAKRINRRLPIESVGTAEALMVEKK